MGIELVVLVAGFFFEALLLVLLIIFVNTSRSKVRRRPVRQSLSKIKEQISGDENEED